MSQADILSISDKSSNALIDFKLSDDILTNKTYYYFNLLDPRFNFINKYVCNTLERIYNKRVEPIFVYPDNSTITKSIENYIIINRNLDNHLKKGFQKIILGSSSLEMNQDFSNLIMIRQLSKDLIKKQGKIFINSFNTSCMDLDSKDVNFIGPSPMLAKYFDSKINQRDFFRKIGVQIPEYKVFDNYYKLKEEFDRGNIGSSFIASEYSSGGNGTSLVRSIEDIEIYQCQLKEHMFNKRFISSLIINSWCTPNITGLVLGKDNIFICSVSDQLLDGYKYRGNIYPSTLPDKTQKEIIEITRNIGFELAKTGYRGFYGCDFVIDKDNNLFVVDLNPRKQGGYLCNFLMFENIKEKNIPSLVELEIRATMGEELDYDLHKFENPMIDYYWAHTKIPPNKNCMIQNEIHKGTEMLPFERIGKTFVTTFYSPNYFYISGSKIGTIISTDLNRKKLLKRLIRKRNQVREIITPSISIDISETRMIPILSKQKVEC